MEHRYLNESHKRSSLVAQKEVAEMLQHPLSAEQAMEKSLQNLKLLRKTVIPESDE